MPSHHPSLAARWVAAQRLHLARTRPSTPGGDVPAESRLYRDVARGPRVPVGRASDLAQRTQVIDAEVAGALGRGTAQVVLLGAGYDGRPLRFGGGAVRWFEVDKRRRLGALGIATGQTTFVGLDRHVDDLGSALGTALGTAGHDAAAPTLFVAEDVLQALTLEATAAYCAALRARAATGSVLVATFSVLPVGGTPVRALRTAAAFLRRAADEGRGHEFRPGDPEKLMVVTGWRVTHAASSPESRLDPGAHLLALVCEPDPARGGVD